MIVRHVWYLKEYPDDFIAELSDGNFVLFKIIPYRTIVEKDLKKYEGDHPRKKAGVQLLEYQYREYGLALTRETSSEVVRVRLTPSEKEIVKKMAGARGLSEFIRGLIRKELNGEL
jgi:hypothetical protein